MPNPHWLDPVAAEAARPGPLLVVCRTSATVREVMRRLAMGAERGEPSGFAGLQVTTLGGLVVAAEPGRLFPVDAEEEAEPLPPRHPWAKLLQDRPGLSRMLAARLQRAHEARATGAALEGLRPELRALVDAGWRRPGGIGGAERLLSSPRPEGRVIAVGFGQVPFSFVGGLSALDRRLLAWLAPDLVLGGEDPAAVKLAAPIPALRLADVAAEARAVAREAGRASAAGGRVLVLSPDTGTSERIAAALRRNGVPVADDGAVPLSRHALVSAIRPLLPVFATRGEAPADGADLVRLLTDAVLSRSAPAGGISAIPELGDAKPRASTRHVRELLANCRRARAPIAAWTVSLGAAEEEAARALAEADEDDRPSRARHLASARVLLAQITALAEHSRGGHLRDVERFLSAVKLSDPEGDRLGRAVLGALAREGFRPPTEHDLDDALAGGVPRGRVDRGVIIFPYESYDGRDADLTLLAGVHEKGLGRVPAPDPFLHDGDLTALAQPDPAGALAERLALARWAACRARRALALVATTDASGRAVSPPVDLALEFHDIERGDSYGRRMDLPERRDLAAFAPGQGVPDRLAVQIDAEWVRRGASFDEDDEAIPAVAGETLADQLARDLPRVPGELRPWVGEVGAHPRGDGSGLPRDFALSASRLGKFTACLYHGFLDSVLKLRTQQEIAEELDPREVGSAIHAALERAMKKAKLLVPVAKLDDARTKLVTRLMKETEKAATELAEAMPGDAEALRIAREGYVGRWLANWSGWVDQRMRSVEEVEAKEGGSALAELDPALVESVVAALDQHGMKPGPRLDLAKGVREALVASGGDPQAFLAAGAIVTGRLKDVHKPKIAAALKKAAAREAVTALCTAGAPLLRGAGYDATGDLEVVGTEVRFGDMPDEDGNKGPPLSLRLGRAAVPVRGSIDLVLRRRGRNGSGNALRVRDYKTGSLSGKTEHLAVNLLRPQLALYALVVEAAGEELLGKGAVGEVEHLMLDHVKVLKTLQTSVGPDDLARVKTALGQLLDRARDGSFPSLPHPAGCPMISDRGAYCDFPEVCRIRARYEAAEADEEVEA